jgi:LysR family transcriptional regulator, cell division regulator
MGLIEHLEKLRYFQKMSHFRSMSEAAKNIGISQPGLSKSIATLEEVLGVSLFIRSASGLLLTNEGKAALEMTNLVFDMVSKLETHLKSIRTSPAPTRLCIGMYDSIAVYFLDEFLHFFNKIYTDVQFEFVVDKSSALISALRNDKIDMALGTNFLLEADAQKEKYVQLGEDFYSFYKTPLLTLKTNTPLIIHPEAKDKEGQTLQSFVKKKYAKRQVFHVYNFETIKELTLKGFGVGILPTKVAKPLEKNNQLMRMNLSKEKILFGAHEIGFLVRQKFYKEYPELSTTIIQIGERWFKL